MASSSPIGVFDSGVGGISVLQHIHALLPSEHIIYVADSYNAPYGSKSPEFITERASVITNFLVDMGVKALVVACNTATAAAASMLRQNYTLPIIAMEPAVKPAVAATKTGVVGVLATVGTLKSAQFAALLDTYAHHVNIVTQGCIGLVECIERGELKEMATRKLLEQYLAPLLNAGADTIVLGCTHYPFVRELISEIAGAHVSLIDTGEAVARQLQHKLQENSLLNEDRLTGVVRFWTNSPDDNAGKVIEKLWGSAVSVTRLPQI